MGACSSFRFLIVSIFLSITTVLQQGAAVHVADSDRQHPHGRWPPDDGPPPLSLDDGALSRPSTGVSKQQKFAARDADEAHHSNSADSAVAKRPSAGAARVSHSEQHAHPMTSHDDKRIFQDDEDERIETEEEEDPPADAPPPEPPADPPPDPPAEPESGPVLDTLLVPPADSDDKPEEKEDKADYDLTSKLKSKQSKLSKDSKDSDDSSSSSKPAESKEDPKKAEESGKEKVGDSEGECVLSSKPDVPLGFSDEDWHAISFEIEMFSKNTNETKDSNKAHFKTSVLGAVEYEGQCEKRLFEVTERPAYEASAWLYELEKNEARMGLPLMYEVSSPITLQESEAEIAIAQSEFMSQFFAKVPHQAFRHRKPYQDDPPGLHIHVDSKCLLDGKSLGLVAVLLIWEKFDKAIYDLTMATLHAETADKVGTLHGKGWGSNQKAMPLSFKSEELFEELLKYLGDEKLEEPEPDDESEERQDLTAIFNKHEKGMKGDGGAADGYRRFEVNVCHLLNVKCAHSLAKKNAVPKFGALEFRGFDPMIGQPLRLTVQLVLRLVQLGCMKDEQKDPKIKALLWEGGEKWDGKTKAEDASALLKALDLDPDVFAQSVFKESPFNSN